MTRLVKRRKHAHATLVMGKFKQLLDSTRDFPVSYIRFYSSTVWFHVNTTKRASNLQIAFHVINILKGNQKGQNIFIITILKCEAINMQSFLFVAAMRSYLHIDFRSIHCPPGVMLDVELSMPHESSFHHTLAVCIHLTWEKQQWKSHHYEWDFSSLLTT